MTIETQLNPGDIVCHITDNLARGVVIAFMARGANHSYEIQWGIEKCQWHIDFELSKVEEQPKRIGFWHPGGIAQ